MITAQKFLQSFLKERAAIYAEANMRLAPLYAKCFGEPLSQYADDFLLRDKEDHVFEDMKESGEFATIVTREQFKVRALRTRYHLAASGDTWKIARIEMECFLCQRTGRTRDGAICRQCGGE